MAPTMAASELSSLFVCVFCVFLCFSSHSTVVSFGREELLNIKESSLGIFSPSIIDPRFTELLASGAVALNGILRRKRWRGKRADALVKFCKTAWLHFCRGKTSC
ncbi:hypothetical protein ILYODFUR_039126 [Ilyodon furcidens]|uniref:Secreted protein n=1 Tax=Ilyodon furcidens TaxID=33524 RepID=A0ABV0T434_9TELE